MFCPVFVKIGFWHCIVPSDVMRCANTMVFLSISSWKTVRMSSGKFSTLFTVFASLATVLGSWYMVSRGTLTYSISKMQPLLAEPSYGSHQLQLSLDNQLISEPYLAEVKIWNSGLKPLAPSAYEDEFELGRGLNLEVTNRKCHILACEVASMVPSNRAKHEILTKSSSSPPRDFLIKPIGLNPYEGFDIRLITEGSPESVRINGHITDFSIQQASEFDLVSLGSQIQNIFQQIWNLIGLLIVLLTLAFASLVLLFFRKVKTFFENYTFDDRVRAKVKTYEEAKQLLLNQKAFVDFGTEHLNLNMKSQVAQTKLRVALAKIEPDRSLKLNSEKTDLQVSNSDGEKPPELGASSKSGALDKCTEESPSALEKGE